MALQSLRLVTPVNDVDGVNNNLRDIEGFANAVYMTFQNIVEPPPTGEFRLLVLEDDGLVYPWELVSGSGCTLTFDPVTRTATLTVP